MRVEWATRAQDENHNLKPDAYVLEGITPEYSYVMLFECDQEGSKIKNNKIEPIEKGKEYTFIADPHAAKVRNWQARLHMGSHQYS